ncbi:hypothetical protein [Paraflavitalea sp. CAU 1676]|uniref:hypothetical protein n=1 Tax=Paraflavitalea sp. CAU 1676 TaxID=3032598 RepID=UPI0023DC8F28|nr:hypothetical protein [Paraflavitalea sp. CAU 1676]MDF2192521.1 hypothetical protein [Paraflavitalea sp. CAU 1676]
MRIRWMITVVVLATAQITLANTQQIIAAKLSSDTSAPLALLNKRQVLRANYEAYSTLGADGNPHSNGWYASTNYPSKKRLSTRLPVNALSLTIDTARLDTFSTHYQAYPLYIVNTTTDTLQFKAMDSRLYMRMQALNEEGHWQDIEYLQRWASCGNSYHRIRLEPDAHWKFVVPHFEGTLQTKLRVVLEYIDPHDPGKIELAFSNTINVRLNPSQFLQEQSEFPLNAKEPIE